MQDFIGSNLIMGHIMDIFYYDVVSNLTYWFFEVPVIPILLLLLLSIRSAKNVKGMYENHERFQTHTVKVIGIVFIILMVMIFGSLYDSRAYSIQYSSSMYERLFHYLAIFLELVIYAGVPIIITEQVWVKKLKGDD